MKGKEGTTIISVHYTPATFSAPHTHKGLFVILIVGTIQSKQTPIGLSAQRNCVIGKQTLYMVEGKEDGHRRLRNVKTEANQLKSFDEGPTVRAKLSGSDIKDPKHRLLELGEREIQVEVLYEPSIHIERSWLRSGHAGHILALSHRL
jgi:hypothetical protein